MQVAAWVLLIVILVGVNAVFFRPIRRFLLWRFRARRAVYMHIRDEATTKRRKR